MPNRHNVDAEGYRYAYQGQEKDPETGKEAFQLRLWDSRIGRWLTTDPKHAGVSPYWGMNNNPLTIVDPDGGSGEKVDDWILGKNGYYWDENITSKSQAEAAGLDWAGKTLEDVDKHFKINNSFWSRVYGGAKKVIDFSSYYKAKYDPIIQNSIDKQASTWEEYEYMTNYYSSFERELADRGYPLSFDGGVRADYYLDRMSHQWEGSLVIDGKIVNYTAIYRWKNSSVRYINQVRAYDTHPLKNWNFYIGNGGTGKNVISLGNNNLEHSGIILILIHDTENYHFTTNYIYQGHLY